MKTTYCFISALAKASRIILLTAALVAPCASIAIGGGVPSARSVAMGQASMGLAAGVDAARFNPANLGFHQFRLTQVELLNVGVNVSNNAFTLGDYNNYSGAFLTDADKTELLDKVPDEGLSLSGDVEASAFSFAFGSFVFSASGVGAADVDINKELVDLALHGNSFADTIRVEGSYSDAVAYASFGLSYGRKVYTSGTRELSLGGTVKYLRGIGVEKIVELNGLASTEVSGFAGSGNMIVHTASGGRGYGLDMGAALKIDNNYTAGISIKNIVSSISWNNQPEEHGYLFSFDTVTVDNMGDSFVVSDDYTRDIASFSTTVPSTMTIGLANTSGKLVWAVDWEQGFSTRAGSSTKPRVGAGLQYSHWKYLPLRTGFSVGGSKNTAFSFGSGIDLGTFYLDYAIVTGSSLTANSSKGLNFAVTTGLRF
ncbi:MAG: DUF5723 family protein [Candidatus Zixiibacteriota bacterium]